MTTSDKMLNTHKKARTPFWRDPEYILSSLLAAYIITAINLDRMIAETERTANKVHLRTLFNANMVPHTLITDITNGHTYALSFERRTRREVREAAKYEDGNQVCFAITSGYRIPFTNMVYAASSVGCGRNETNAMMAHQNADQSYDFRY